MSDILAIRAEVAAAIAPLRLVPVIERGRIEWWGAGRFVSIELDGDAYRFDIGTLPDFGDPRPNHTLFFTDREECVAHTAQAVQRLAERVARRQR